MRLICTATSPGLLQYNIVYVKMCVLDNNIITCHVCMYMYHIVEYGEKTLVNSAISYYLKEKTLVNGCQFAKFANVFSHQRFLLYGVGVRRSRDTIYGKTFEWENFHS